MPKKMSDMDKLVNYIINNGPLDKGELIIRTNKMWGWNQSKTLELIWDASFSNKLSDKDETLKK